LYDARYIIKKAIIGKKNIAVAVSGGKDSIAMCGIVCEFCKPVIIWNDSDFELPESYFVIKQISDMYNLKIIIAKGNAYDKVLIASNDDVIEDVIIRPVKKVMIENNIDIEFVGLRQSESKKRKMLLRKYGPIHESKRWGITIAWPMTRWEGIDCLAYITENNLPLHPAYMRSKNPEKTRVSWIFDWSREQPSETEYVRKYYPEIYRKLREKNICQ
jgi:3'-phosphoadenosine 5'-phosphosulfate sulfotransferase (PAPS reductase)/FAD synthetase